MNQIEAFDRTLRLARDRRMNERRTFPREVSFAHLTDMRRRVDAGFSPAKLGRWLGWAQAALVAAGVATLEEVKAINREAGEDPQQPTVRLRVFADVDGHRRDFVLEVAADARLWDLPEHIEQLLRARLPDRTVVVTGAHYHPHWNREAEDGE